MTTNDRPGLPPGLTYSEDVEDGYVVSAALCMADRTILDLEEPSDEERRLLAAVAGASAEIARLRAEIERLVGRLADEVAQRQRITDERNDAQALIGTMHTEFARMLRERDAAVAVAAEAEACMAVYDEFERGEVSATALRLALMRLRGAVEPPRGETTKL